MKKKILLILIFINIFKYYSASTIDIEQLLKNLEDSCMHCKAEAEHQEKMSNVKKILSEKEFYEFNYKNENEEYKFFIPRGTIIEGSIIRKNEKTYIKKDSLYLSPFPVWLRKKEIFLS